MTGEPDELAAWTAFYDLIENGARALAARVMAGDDTGWTFVPPPPGPVPESLLQRHDRLLAQLQLLGTATELRLHELRRELGALAHPSPSYPAQVAVGRALDVLG